MLCTSLSSRLKIRTNEITIISIRTISYTNFITGVLTCDEPYFYAERIYVYVQRYDQRFSQVVRTFPQYHCPTCGKTKCALFTRVWRPGWLEKIWSLINIRHVRKKTAILKLTPRTGITGALRSCAQLDMILSKWISITRKKKRSTTYSDTKQ